MALHGLFASLAHHPLLLTAGSFATMAVLSALKRAGPSGRRMAWNIEFQRGPSFVGTRSHDFVELIRRFGEGSAIVELACGDGTLARFVSGARFTSYRGFDVSDEAIRRARDQAAPGQTFEVQTMEAWNPTEPFNLLIIEEAIYYLSTKNQRRLFKRAFAKAPDAKVIVAVHSAEKHAQSLNVCRASAQVLEEHRHGARAYLVLAKAAR